jgi:hypothetical protein
MYSKNKYFFSYKERRRDWPYEASATIDENQKVPNPADLI